MVETPSTEVGGRGVSASTCLTRVGGVGDLSVRGVFVLRSSGVSRVLSRRRGLPSRRDEASVFTPEVVGWVPNDGGALTSRPGL